MLVIVTSNQTRAARSFDFEITRMISGQIVLHSVQLPLLIRLKLLDLLLAQHLLHYRCFEVARLFINQSLHFLKRHRKSRVKDIFCFRLLSCFTYQN